MFDNFAKSTNQLLAALSGIQYQRLVPHLEEVILEQGQIIYDFNQKITKVYFPQQAVISLVLVMSNNSMAEISSVGKEGMIGLPVFLGDNLSANRTMVKISGSAIELSANILKREFHKSQELQKLLLSYTQVRLNQVSQIASCKSHHTIEQRYALWLLLACDSREQNIVPLTQKFMAQMLGVRRASVTEVAIHLQKSGIISYRRGQITVLERKQLETVACECYGAIRNEFNRLLTEKH